MSIPVSIDPLGTLGGGYVRGGLKLFVDSLATDKAELIDIVSNSILPITDGTVLGKNANGSISVNGAMQAVPWPDNVTRVSSPTLELVISPAASVTYGFLSTPFGGDLQNGNRYAAVGLQSVAARNDTGVIGDLETEPGSVVCASFVSNEEIFVNGMPLVDIAGTTGSWSASKAPSLISLFWTTRPQQEWSVFAIRYYDRKLSADEVRKNHLLDKKRYNLQ